VICAGRSPAAPRAGVLSLPAASVGLPMPTIVFERTRHVAHRPEGGRVVDVCDDDLRAGVPFACRHANCGTCRVRLTEGAELCDPPGEDERALLTGRFRDPPDVRLACQLVVRPGEGTVRLRVLL